MYHKKHIDRKIGIYYNVVTIIKRKIKVTEQAASLLVKPGYKIATDNYICGTVIFHRCFFYTVFLGGK